MNHTCLLLFCFLSVELSAADLAAAVHSASVPQAFNGATGNRYPIWTGDSLVSLTPASTGTSDRKAVTAIVYDRNGKQIASPSIWVEGAARVFTNRLAVNSENRVMAGGHAVSTNGKMIGFLMIADLTGKPQTVIATTPYVPEAVCFGSDGGIWTLLSLIDMDGSGRSTDYKMLRHYSASNGALISEALSRSRFSTDLPPAVEAGPGQEVMMDCNKGGVGIYFGHASVWIEVTNGGTITEYPFPRKVLDGSGLAGTRQIADGIALLDSGSLYANFSNASQTGLYRLDKQGSRWIAVPGTAGSRDKAVLARLHGKDSSGMLVFSSSLPGRSTNDLYFGAIE